VGVSTYINLSTIYDCHTLYCDIFCATLAVNGISTYPPLLRSMLTQIGRQACVFTFGYGSEHDADLLHAVADVGNGLFYYIENKDSIPESFCDCLGELFSVAAQVGH